MCARIIYDFTDGVCLFTFFELITKRFISNEVNSNNNTKQRTHHAVSSAVSTLFVYRFGAHFECLMKEMRCQNWRSINKPLNVCLCVWHTGVNLGRMKTVSLIMPLSTLMTMHTNASEDGYVMMWLPKFIYKSMIRILISIPSKQVWNTDDLFANKYFLFRFVVVVKFKSSFVFSIFLYNSFHFRFAFSAQRQLFNLFKCGW